MFKIKIAVFVALVAVAGAVVYKDNRPVVKDAVQTVPGAEAAVNNCLGSSAGRTVIVSVSKRHMWACQDGSQVYEAKAITGYEGYPETLTPVGSYTVSDKMISQPLVGSDRLGSWNVHVDYWLPFLTNQYGNYGFHDATWRPDSDFGNIDPNSKEASHGCVEIPLSAMKWLYDWSSVGTSVIINS